MESIRGSVCLILCSIALMGQAQEVCDNGVDDDADGLVDLRDTTDCACPASTMNNGGLWLPNPSFEQQDCIPNDYGQPGCATGWEMGTFGTSDYCATNGFLSPYMPSQPADGIGMMGAHAFNGYIEYLGACLLFPLEQGHTYDLTLQLALSCAGQPPALGPADVAIFGLGSCPTFPTPTLDCPIGAAWAELGRATYTPSPGWSSLTITFTPWFDVQAVLLGGACVLPPEYNDICNPYFTFDDLHMTERVQAHLTFEDNGSYCTGDRVLVAHPDQGGDGYQWYLDSVALAGRTDTILDLSAYGLDPGEYQFRILFGDTACAVFPYTVSPDRPPELRPAMGVHEGCAPLTVSFSHTTDPDSIATVWWDFGDGDVAYAAMPSHTYTEPGTYAVSFHVVAPNGCAGDTTLPDMVTVHPAPVASFTADQVEGCRGMQVQFTNTTDLPTVSWAWVFGDGGTSAAEDPLHAYDLSGLHDVRLTVTTPYGCMDDTLMHALIDTHPDPDVSFTAIPPEGCAPFEVLFTNTTPATQVATVFWDFGQGDTSMDAQPTARYGLPGPYTVRLRVTDAIGCVGEQVAVDLVAAHPIPDPSFTFGPDSGCAPLEVAFVNTTDPALTGTCSWGFGDGNGSTGCDPVHAYVQAGVYDVRLEVASAFGCAGDTTYPGIVTVFGRPEAAFTFGPQPTDVFSTAQVFVDESSSDAITWAWVFQGGDPGTADGPDQEVLFPGGEPGRYAVRLVVSNAHACTDTAFATVIIGGHFSVFAPNAFTPDGDGLNDGWRPICKDLDPASYVLRIYDRWGRVIWTTTDAASSWDGQLDGEAAKNDVYAWQLDVRDQEHHLARRFLGHVTVVR